MTEARTLTPIDHSPLYAEGVHMLEEHPTIVPLFEVDVLSAMEPYIATNSKPDELHEPDLT